MRNVNIFSCRKSERSSIVGNNDDDDDYDSGGGGGGVDSGLFFLCVYCMVNEMKQLAAIWITWIEFWLSLHLKIYKYINVYVCISFSFHCVERSATYAVFSWNTKKYFRRWNAINSCSMVFWWKTSVFCPYSFFFLLSLIILVVVVVDFGLTSYSKSGRQNL